MAWKRVLLYLGTSEAPKIKHPEAEQHSPLTKPSSELLETDGFLLKEGKSVFFRNVQPESYSYSRRWS